MASSERYVRGTGQRNDLGPQRCDKRYTQLGRRFAFLLRYRLESIDEDKVALERLRVAETREVATHVALYVCNW